MKYLSTRGQRKGTSFEEVLFSGYSSDGGMYMPETVPHISGEILEKWSTLSYTELMKRILPLFISEQEVPSHDLCRVVDEAFKKFSLPEVVQVTTLKKGLNIAELYHGVTLAFKDLSLAVIGHLLSYFLKKSQKHLTILIGTSGDTGSASLEAVRDLSMMDIIVLFPKGRCTKIQELQMTTVIEDNVHLYAVEGTSDDLDVPIKECFKDEDFVQQHHLCSINSVNWGRILGQVVHYFFSYFRVCEKIGEKVEFVVPTGAAGNITAGCVAAKMGLPITIVACVNKNNIVHRTLSNGDFTMTGMVDTSWAPAMDIQVPYNVERLMFLFSNGDTQKVTQLMEIFETKKGVQIPPEILASWKMVLTESLCVPDDAILETMQWCWRENQYLLCPHTAVGVTYHYQRRRMGILYPQVCLASASPAKFPEAVLKAGLTPQPLKKITQLFQKMTKYEWMKAEQDWTKMLKNKIEEITVMRKNQSNY